MIKILHYCWFGGNPLPPSVVKYMESWKKFCPDFELKLWDENNFDVHSVPFVHEAYEAKKWAFVSDYVRTYALYEEGGLYVDTDVEFIKPIVDLIENSFIGFETPDIVNPGLILYAKVPKQDFFGKVLKHYNQLHFSDEVKSEISSPNIYTKILKEEGLILDNSLQQVGEIIVYPTEYFQPLGDSRYGLKKQFTVNTRTIHHYDASWLNKIEKEYYFLRKKYGNFWGKVFFTFKHPIIAFNKLKNNG